MRCQIVQQTAQVPDALLQGLGILLLRREQDVGLRRTLTAQGPQGTADPVCVARQGLPVPGGRVVFHVRQHRPVGAAVGVDDPGEQGRPVSVGRLQPPA